MGYTHHPPKLLPPYTPPAGGVPVAAGDPKRKFFWDFLDNYAPSKRTFTSHPKEHLLPIQKKIFLTIPKEHLRPIQKKIFLTIPKEQLSLIRKNFFGIFWLFFQKNNCYLTLSKRNF
jgi:hypothetical protein